MSIDIPTAIEVRERHAEPKLSLEVAWQHIESLMALREEAYGRLLHPGWAFNATLRPYDVNESSEARRPLPTFAQNGGTYCFLFTEALQPFMPAPTGDINQGNWSQVWIATVRSLEDGTTEPGTVVLRIYQPSLLPIPHWCPAVYNVTKFSARRMADTESSSYQHLGSVQGAAVPYFFGQYEVCMPNGETAQVIVTEYIPGVDLENWCSRYRCMEINDCQRKIESELPGILLSAYNSAKAINSCNIIHAGVSPHSMIIYKGVGGESEAVFVNFGYGQNAKTMKKKREWAEPERTVIWIVQLCCGYYANDAKLKKWAKRRGNLPEGCTWNENSVKEL